MRICLLTDQDLDNQPLPDDDWPCDPRPYLPDAEWGLGVLEKEDAVLKIISLSRQGYDVFFNLCDGAWDEGRVGVEVVLALERLEVPFTGASSAFFEPTREAMKRVCHASAIDTPGYVIASTRADLERALDTLAFPLIVKHPNSYASAGLTRASRVETASEFREQAELMIAAYGETLVEEFIEGGECTVLVAEDPEAPRRLRTFTPIEYGFPEGESFKHEKLKWEDYDGLVTRPLTDPELNRRVREASALFFEGMRGTGYARCDFRIDRDGRPFMLEINPNCGLFYPEGDYGSADLCLAADPMGHVGFTELVVRSALARHRRVTTPWRTRHRPDGEYRVFARRDIGEGDVVVRGEGESHRLASRALLAAGERLAGLGEPRDGARPLTDELWMIRGAAPENWCPIGHSCEPNAWLDGLDVVARRAISRGEEITLEYATFCHPGMAEFTCACGSARCRGTIRGSDALSEVVDAYEGHISPFLLRLRGARQTG